jgi:hypothetical protein
MELRNRYWDVMQDVAETRFGCGMVLERLNRRNQWIDAAIAGLSCGAITTFLAWDKARIWTGAVAAVAQVAAAVKPVMEFSRRRETLVDVMGRLCMLAGEMEKDFLRVEDGTLDGPALEVRIDYYNAMHSNIAQGLTNHGVSFDDFAGVAEAVADEARKYMERIGQVSMS